jgi:GT2 family glycosyltransferase
MENYPKVAIIYLTYYHDQSYIDDALQALQKSTYPKECIEFIIVDNPHPELGLSQTYIEQFVLPRSQKDLPKITYLPQGENKGFCGGNNVGLVWAMEHGFEYAYLHNQDGFMAPDCLKNLVEALEKDSRIGCAQSSVLLFPEIDKLNSVGNSFHYLGFGYIPNFGENFNPAQLPKIKNIGYASGASLILRIALVKEFGFLEEKFFLYHEDIEYSLRLRINGFDIVCVSGAIFFHKYVFNRNTGKFYYMERNRFAVLLMYLKWPTILLILPPLVLMEFGLCFFFIKKRWIKERLRVYAYWLSPSNWGYWLKRRKIIQKNRVISDRAFLSSTSSVIQFGEKKDMDSGLLRYMVNPFLAVYGFVVKKIIFW